MRAIEIGRQHRASDGQGLEVQVDVVEELGADAYIYGRTPGSDEGPMVARVSGRDVPEKGSKLYFTTKAERIHLCDRTTGERIES